jgi:PAS domain S-box-containing protein
MSPHQTPSRPALSSRAIALFVVSFIASTIIWPLSMLTTTIHSSRLWVFLLSFVLAAISQVILYFRYSAAPSFPRFYANIAFCVYLLSSVVLWLGGLFLVGLGATMSVSMFQTLALFLPRVFLAAILLVAVIALEHPERDEGVGNMAYGGLVWVGCAIMTFLMLTFGYVLPISQNLSMGIVHQPWELLPLILFFTSFCLTLRQGAWMIHYFAYGLLWFFLFESIASLYFLFSSSTGTSFGMAGIVAHLLALAAPLVTMQIQMLLLYHASEVHRIRKRLPRFGSQGIHQKLEADVFRRSVEQSQDALYIANADGEIVFVNQGFVNMTGYELKDVRGKTPDSWSHKMEGQESYLQVFAGIRLRKEPFIGNRWSRRRDGTPYEAAILISPVVDEFSDVSWFIARERDLTEGRERTLLLQQILDNMPIGICMVEVPSTKIVLSNQYAGTLLAKAGFRDLVQFGEVSETFRLLGGEKYPQEKMPLEETLRTREGAAKDDIELPVAMRSDGEGKSMIWRMHTTPIFDAHGDLKHVLVALDDVTRQKLLEHKMSDAISVASHQLRTPLTGIKWAVDELRKGEEFGASKEDKIAIFDTLYDATVRMFNVVQGLLDVSKLEQGKVTIKPEPLSLKKLVNEVIEELMPRITEKNIIVKQSTLHSIPETPFDVLLVRQVIQNLLDNAIKYTPENGEIDSVLSVEKGKIIWVLHDTGIGIPKDELEHLYEKFHRGDNAQKVDAYGMGLGLYTVKMVMDLLEGEMRCESEEGRGTTFRAFFPIKKGSS